MVLLILNFGASTSLIGGFQNKSHWDNDVTRYTTGVWAPVRKSHRRIVTIGDGDFNSLGHFFCCTVYKTLIDFDTADGITEILWCGARTITR